jgi:hypothetical protein
MDCVGPTVAQTTKEKAMIRKREPWFILALVIVAVVGFFAAVTPSAARPINCKIVSCPAPQCLDNEHLQVPPGQCCPVCVPN